MRETLPGQFREKEPRVPVTYVGHMGDVPSAAVLVEGRCVVEQGVLGKRCRSSP